MDLSFREIEIRMYIKVIISDTSHSLRPRIGLSSFGEINIYGTAFPISGSWTSSHLIPYIIKQSTFSKIWQLLTFQDPADDWSFDASSPASCRGYGVPRYPKVRFLHWHHPLWLQHHLLLRLTSTSLSKPRSRIPHSRLSLPAYLTHILGEEWQSRLIEPDSNDQNYKNRSYIPPPRDDAVDEAQYCLRMKSCAAAHAKDLYGVLGGRSEEPPKQIFGWPSSGGVWVFQLPNLPKFEDGDPFPNLEERDEILNRIHKLKPRLGE